MWCLKNDYSHFINMDKISKKCYIATCYILIKNRTNICSNKTHLTSLTNVYKAENLSIAVVYFCMFAFKKQCFDKPWKVYLSLVHLPIELEICLLSNSLSLLYYWIRYITSKALSITHFVKMLQCLSINRKR